MKRSESRRIAATLRREQIRAKAVLPRTDTPEPTFVADVMLGRLARWLRIAGFDVLYSNRFTDEELVELSNRECRILLSRDTRLLVRKAVGRFIFLASEEIRSQVREVLAVTGARAFPGILSRCLACNDRLENVSREQVRERVPPFVFETQAQFKFCPRCGKIYWAGTHRASVVQTLNAILPP
jgi:uncharacterized protein with PIN domain